MQKALRWVPNPHNAISIAVAKLERRLRMSQKWAMEGKGTDFPCDDSVFDDSDAPPSGDEDSSDDDADAKGDASIPKDLNDVSESFASLSTTDAGNNKDDGEDGGSTPRPRHAAHGSGRDKNSQDVTMGGTEDGNVTPQQGENAEGSTKSAELPDPADIVMGGNDPVNSNEALEDPKTPGASPEPAPENAPGSVPADPAPLVSNASNTGAVRTPGASPSPAPAPDPNADSVNNTVEQPPVTNGHENAAQSPVGSPNPEPPQNEAAVPDVSELRTNVRKCLDDLTSADVLKQVAMDNGWPTDKAFPKGKRSASTAAVVDILVERILADPSLEPDWSKYATKAKRTSDVTDTNDEVDQVE